MSKVKFVLVAIPIILLATAAFQVIPPVLENYALQDDMHDVAAMGGSRVGLLPESSAVSLVDSVIERAKDRGIELRENQVTVEHGHVSGDPTVILEASYTVPVNLFGFRFELYFYPSSRSRSLW